jgi:DNA gyrase inhibitor GyrI
MTRKKESKMNNESFSTIGMETLDPLHVACYRAASPTPEDDASRYLEDWIARQNLSLPARHFGFDVDVTGRQRQAGYRGYEVWVTVPTDVPPSAGVTIRDFQGGLYAVMTIYTPFDDPFARIPSGWKRLHEWVIQSNRCRGAGHQWLEELITGEGGNDLRLYHPITLLPAR